MIPDSDSSTPDLSGATAGRLASVRLLLSSERDVAAHDLLLATVIEYLESGPKNTQELVRRLELIWPGIPVTRHVLDAALSAAQSAGYVGCEQTMSGKDTWTLADRGRIDLTASRSWADDVLGRATAEVHRQAMADLGIDDVDSAARWRDILLDAIGAGLQKAFAANPAAIDILGEKFLFPAKIDLAVVDASIGDRCSTEEVSSFLRSMARLAVDPAQVFGTELVHTLTAGYVMRSFAAGYDNQEARRAVGPMTGEVLLLDTPVLLQLGGPNQAAEPAWSILAQARKHKVRVVVAAETLEELQRVLNSRDEEARVLEADLISGQSEPLHLRATVRDGVLLSWLSCEPIGTAPWLPWADYRVRLEQLGTTVQAIGGEVGFAPDGVELLSRTEFDKAIRNSLEERGSGRGDPAVEHDVELLRLLHAARVANPPNGEKVWPGAVALSSDSHLVGSYRRAVTTEISPIPPAMTIGQWGSLLAKCCQPADVEELALAIGSDLSFRSTIARGTNVPVETALEIARSLKGTSPTEASMQSIQLSIDDLLESQPDLVSSPDGASSVAGKVLAKRHADVERVAAQQREATREATDRAEKHRLVRETELRTIAESKLTENELLKGRSEAAEQSARTAAAALVTERNQSSKRLKRVVAAASGCFLLVLAIVIAATQGWVDTRGIVVASIAALIAAAAAVEWVTNLETPWWRVGLGLVVGAGWLALELILGASK